MKFELVSATDITTFNELVNQRANDGWKFVGGQPMIISNTNSGLQYSIAMLLEEPIPVPVSQSTTGGQV